MSIHGEASGDRSNWAGTYTYTAPTVRRPESVADVQRIVAGGTAVRALGTRHSFTDLPDTAGTLIEMTALAGAVATGTHGSGNSLGILSTAVSAIEFVDAGGRPASLRGPSALGQAARLHRGRARGRLPGSDRCPARVLRTRPGGEVRQRAPAARSALTPPPVTTL